MTRAFNRLSAKEVSAAQTGKHADGGGLWLYKRKTGSTSWVFRFHWSGNRHEMGLGKYPALSLKEARQAAEKCRGIVRQGLNPMNERDAAIRAQARNLHLLKDVALDAFESRKADLKGDGSAGRWFSPIEIHILPKLGNMRVSDITQSDVRKALAPIWHEKAATAHKAINRLGICLKHAAALGLDVDLQAVDKAKALLGKQRHTVQNVPALHWHDVPTFYQTLDEGTVTHLALRLLILTAVRSKPLRFMRFDQIEGDVWTIPAEDMKGRKGATSEFRVPLSTEAQRVIAEAAKFARDGYLFPSVRKGVISDATMSRLMERRGMTERPHGFRSSFRDWVAETTNTPHDVAETCLGHAVGGSVERAYRRTDYLEQRRLLMEHWSTNCLHQALHDIGTM